MAHRRRTRQPKKPFKKPKKLWPINKKNPPPHLHRSPSHSHPVKRVTVLSCSRCHRNTYHLEMQSYEKDAGSLMPVPTKVYICTECRHTRKR